MQASLLEKIDRLRSILQGMQSVLSAFSGGVDSAFVTLAAVRALGSGRVLAVTARSPSVPSAELANVATLATEIGAAHEFLDTHEFENPEYLANPVNRCYFCKSDLYARLVPLAVARGYATVINGVNADDLSDFRPGLAAADEHRVRAPLAEAAISKQELRTVACAWGLAIHDKPASPCLSSRVQYGESITPEKLARIDAAETFLRSLGFRECRVRNHYDLARIEVPASELERLATAALRTRVEQRLRELGYRYVTVDLTGFRSGSMNEVVLGAGWRAVAAAAREKA